MDNSVNIGFLLINKPVGISSYGCIGHIKRILKQKIKKAISFRKLYNQCIIFHPAVFRLLKQ